VQVFSTRTFVPLPRTSWSVIWDYTSTSGIRNHCDDKRAKDNEFAQLRARVNRKHIVPAGPEMILIISRRANRSPIASEG
jgi:hypothetical protein